MKKKNNSAGTFIFFFFEPEWGGINTPLSIGVSIFQGRPYGITFTRGIPNIRPVFNISRLNQNPCTSPDRHHQNNPFMITFLRESNLFYVTSSY